MLRIRVLDQGLSGRHVLEAGMVDGMGVNSQRAKFEMGPWTLIVELPAPAGGW